MNLDFGILVEKVNSIVDGSIRQLPNLIIAVVVFGLIFFAGKIIQRISSRALSGKEHQNIGTVIGRLINWVALIVGLLVAATIVVPGLSAGDLFASLGIGGVAIGFAFKDILQNLLAGILILIREPFKVGDAIKFGDYEGIVEAVETRSTVIKTFDARRVIIPNGEIYTKPVVVNTAHPVRRFDYTVGIGYQCDPEAAKAIAHEALSQIEGVLDDPEMAVVVDELADSSVNIKLLWWVDTTASSPLKIKSEVLAAVKSKFDEGGIEIPYPTRHLLVQNEPEGE
ncbi:MAG: mechanosensitive ion channel family protein [Verrucomicrobiota bacterium]